MEVKAGERVILWGDSLGKGVVWSAQRGRYGNAAVNAGQIVAQRLHITVENRSKFGATAPHGLALMERALAEGVEADAAAIEFGGNDCNFDWASISENPAGQHDPATLPEVFAKTLSEMVELLRAHSIRPILVTLPPINAERYFKFLIGDRLNGANILKWLGDVNRIYRFQELYSATMARVARETQAELIDLRPSCLAAPDFVTRLLCPDGLHINEDGQQFIGDAVAGLLCGKNA